MDRERLRGNLDLLLLSVLAAGPAHGYEVIAALRRRSESTFDLPEGTIYPALHRLEDAGLLASDWADASGRRRRVYALTDKGAAALAAEQVQWRRFAPRGAAGLGGAAWPGRARGTSARCARARAPRRGGAAGSRPRRKSTRAG